MPGDLDSAPSFREDVPGMETEMTEGTPLTPEEYRRLNRDLMEKVLDKAASDELWKQLLLDDPDAAIREASFPEAERLREVRASAGATQEEEGEVTGQISCRPDPRLLPEWDSIYGVQR